MQSSTGQLPPCSARELASSGVAYSVSPPASLAGNRSELCCPPLVCKKEKGPNTLFEWAVGKKDDKKDGEEDKDKNGKEEDEHGKSGNGKDNGTSKNGNGKDKSNGEKKDGNGKENSNGKNGEGTGNGNGKNGNGTNGNDEEKPLKSDRPDFTEASSTVGLGRVQLEAGYTFLRDRDRGTTTTLHSYPEALFRIGMFAEWFELRVGQNVFSERIRSPQENLRNTGRTDLYLGVKLALLEQKESLPEVAMILQTNIPSGANAFNAREMLPGVSLLYSWDLIEDCLALAGSTQINRVRDDSAHFYTEVAQSLSFAYTLSDRLGAYTEWFAFFPTSGLDSSAAPRHFLDGGFTYLLTDNFQLDIRAGVGLNRRADNFFAGSGFVIRF